MQQKRLNKSFIIMAISLALLVSTRIEATPVEKAENVSRPVKADIKVILYSKAGCRYCDLAKSLLKDRKIPHEVVELTNNRELIIKLISQTGQETVPYVFVNDKFIGGYQDLDEFDTAGNFDRK